MTFASAGPKPEEVFTALVNYFFQPTLAHLRKAFDWVKDVYDRAKFEPIERCRDIDRANGMATFRYFRISQRMATRDILAAMDMAGFRPAIYEELLAFANEYQDEQRKLPIVALGSTALVAGRVRLACIRASEENGRELHLYYEPDLWNEYFVFLVVSK